MDSSRAATLAVKADDGGARFVPFADFGVPAEGAYGLAAFSLEGRRGRTFLAVSDFFGGSSSIWSDDQPNGSYSLSQTLPSHAGHAWATMNLGGAAAAGTVTHLFLCNYRTWPCTPHGPVPPGCQSPFAKGITPTNSTLWRWDQVRGTFVLAQEILTHGTNAAEAFVIGGRHYLAVANAHRNVSSRVTEGTVNSTIYRWDAAGGRFAPVQSILTHSALDVKHWRIGGGDYLGFANSPVFSPAEQWSPVFKWDGSRFAPYQNLTGTSGATGLEPFSVGGDSYQAVANRLCPRTGHLCDSTIYRSDRPINRLAPPIEPFHIFAAPTTKHSTDYLERARPNNSTALTEQVERQRALGAPPDDPEPRRVRLGVLLPGRRAAAVLPRAGEPHGPEREQTIPVRRRLGALRLQREQQDVRRRAAAADQRRRADPALPGETRAAGPCSLAPFSCAWRILISSRGYGAAE
jgi:hypothetical protein